MEVQKDPSDMTVSHSNIHKHIYVLGTEDLRKTALKLTLGKLVQGIFWYSKRQRNR